MEKIADHTQWILWQHAMALASDLHVATRESSLSLDAEVHGQLRRTSIALASHIAEAAGRPNRHDRGRALCAARTLVIQAEVQVHICARLSLLSTTDHLTAAIGNLARMLDSEIQQLREQPSRDSRCTTRRTSARAHLRSNQSVG